MKAGYLVAVLLACVTSIASAQRAMPVRVIHPASGGADYFGQAVAVDGDTMIVGSPLDDVDPIPDKGSAHIYRWTGSGWTFEATLTASDGAESDNFGTAVTISGDTVIVGASYDVVGGNSGQGSAYVFTRSGSTWTQQIKLTAPDGAAGEQFGNSVGIDGNTAIIGAVSDVVGTNFGQGSAYVFTRTGSTWTLQTKLIAADGSTYDLFGHSVAIDGDTVIASAYNDAIGLNNSQGSAYIFTRSGSVWSQQAKLTALDGASSDFFGNSVAIDGDTAVVAASYDNVGINAEQGSAYVFTRSGTSWTQRAQLIASDGAAEDEFGSSIAISGDTVIVGSFRDDSSIGANVGAAYVFTRSGATWIQQTKLTAPDGAPSDLFGVSVAISGGTAVVGSYLDDVGASFNEGSAWIYTQVGETWVTIDSVLSASDGASNEMFGYSVAISGNTAIVGAYSDDNGAVIDQGSAYIFVRNNGIWTQQAKLLAADGAANDYFGLHVDIEGDTAIVGAYSDDTGTNTDAGSAYVYTRTGTTWTQQAKLLASTPAIGDNFGWRVAISGDTAIIGAYNDDVGTNTNQGSAYVFVRSGTTWSQQANLVAADGAASDRFGISVAISGETVLVGAYFDDFGSNTNQGSAYVFIRSGVTWTQQAQLLAFDGASNDYFGWAVDMYGDTAVVGAYLDDIGTNIDQGSAYIFTRNGTAWSQQSRVSASDGAANDYFGHAVAIDGDRIVIGAYNDAVGVNLGQGSATLFTRIGATWSEQVKLVSNTGSAGDLLGVNVGISNDTVIAGAYGEDLSPILNIGTASIFEITNEDFSTAQNTATGAFYSSLSAAMLPATGGQQITATQGAWRNVGTLNTFGRSLGLFSSGDLITPSTSTIELAGSSTLGVGALSDIEINGQLRGGGYANVDASRFLLGSRGIMTARTNSSLTINAPIAELDGQTRIEQGASLTFAGTATAIGSTTANSDSSLTVGETFNNIDTFTITTGTINAPLFFNRAQTNIFGTSALFGSLFNNIGATTTIRSGTLYVFGSLTNNGTIIGTICSGCTSTPPNMDVGGSLNLGSAANLNMPFLGSTVRVGGNFDCAINSNTRYNMSLATLQLEGSSSEQTLEVMSLDIGADVNGLDRSISGHYPINTLHIGTSPSVVRLVDNHDNDGAGQTVCEAIYVDTLRIEAGSRLINTSCKIYYNTLINNGVIDMPSNVISMQPTFCPSDFDQSGGVDGDDVIAFFGAWDNGDIAADFDQSGGVDGDDVIGFFAAWDAGC